MLPELQPHNQVCHLVVGPSASEPTAPQFSSASSRAAQTSPQRDGRLLLGTFQPRSWALAGRTLPFVFPGAGVAESRPALRALPICVLVIRVI